MSRYSEVWEPLTLKRCLFVESTAPFLTCAADKLRPPNCVQLYY